jgi:DNA-directed RNA polymerase specialized sigma24 family protein
VSIGSELADGSFEQLAMPHFERLYNFACWLTHDRQEAEDLVQETYAKALKGFALFPAGHEFSRLDLQDLAECVSDFPYRVEGGRDRAARS